MFPSGLCGLVSGPAPRGGPVGSVLVGRLARVLLFLKGTIMSLSYATKAATIACLLSLGFIAHEDNDCYYDSPADDEFSGPVVQAYIYLSQAGYWCVDLDGGYRSPCIWNGPVASWDTSDTSVEFKVWLDKEHAGWNI